MISLRFRVGSVLLALGLASIQGCGGVQDADQPAVGSISVQAHRDDDVRPPGKLAKPKPAQP